MTCATWNTTVVAMGHELETRDAEKPKQHVWRRPQGDEPIEEDGICEAIWGPKPQVRIIMRMSER